MVQISLNKISKKYDENYIIKDISLESKEKEFIVLVGPSGSGKSTIIRIIAGLETDFEGELRFAEQLMNEVAAKDRNLSMVFQNYALYPHKTVFENIAFPLMIQAHPKDLIKEKVHRVAEKLGLLEYLKRKPGQLSGGQKQRVAVARALIKEPRLFLMDEPLSNLDAKLRTSTRQEIKRLYQELNSTFIYVTHDQIEAMSLGDRIAILHEGKIQQFDTPTKVYHEPANTFVASFIGSPPANLFEPNEKFFFAIQQKPQVNLLIGMRPEYLSTEEQGGFIKLEATLINIENLGEELLLYTKLDPAFGIQSPDAYFIAKIKDRMSAEIEPLEEGGKINFFIDPKMIYLFDKRSGLRIS